MAILAFAITAVLALSSQGLRLLRLADENQQAVLLADRLTRETEPTAEDVQTGTEGPFTWERRIAAVPVDAELIAAGGTPLPFFSVSVTVRWGRNRTLQLATLRTAVVPPASSLAPQAQ